MEVRKFIFIFASLKKGSEKVNIQDHLVMPPENLLR